MARVTIRHGFLSLEETAKLLGVSKERSQKLEEIAMKFAGMKAPEPRWRSAAKKATPAAFHANKNAKVAKIEHDATGFWMGIENINKLRADPPAMSAMTGKRLQSYAAVTAGVMGAVIERMAKASDPPRVSAIRKRSLRLHVALVLRRCKKGPSLD